MPPEGMTSAQATLQMMIEDEYKRRADPSGRVDVNKAQPGLLERLFTGATHAATRPNAAGLPGMIANMAVGATEQAVRPEQRDRLRELMDRARQMGMKTIKIGGVEHPVDSFRPGAADQLEVPPAQQQQAPPLSGAGAGPMGPVTLTSGGGSRTVLSPGAKAAIGEYGEASQAVGGINDLLTAARSQSTAEYMAKNREQVAAMQEQRADVDAEWQQQWEERKSAVEEYTSMKPDANRWWKNQSKGNQTMMKIAAAFAGVGRKISEQGRNYVIDALEKEVDRDLKLQEAEIRLKGDKVKAIENGLHFLTKRMGDLDRARQMQRQEMIFDKALELESVADSIKSTNKYGAAMAKLSAAEMKAKHLGKESITSTWSSRQVMPKASGPGGGALDDVPDKVKKNFMELMSSTRELANLKNSYNRLSPIAVSGYLGGAETEEFTQARDVALFNWTKAQSGAQVPVAELERRQKTFPAAQSLVKMITQGRKKQQDLANTKVNSFINSNVKIMQDYLVAHPGLRELAATFKMPGASGSAGSRYQQARKK